MLGKCFFWLLIAQGSKGEWLEMALFPVRVYYVLEIGFSRHADSLCDLYISERVGIVMAKTYGILLYRDTRLVDLEDLLHLIFWNKREYVLPAKNLLSLVAAGRVRRDTWREAAASLGLSKTTYFYILKRLKQLGLVYRDENGVYRISKRFSKNLQRVAEYWEAVADKLGSRAEE